MDWIETDEKTRNSKPFVVGGKQRRKDRNDDNDDEWNSVMSQSQTMTNSAVSLQLLSPPLITRRHYSLGTTTCLALAAVTVTAPTH